MTRPPKDSPENGPEGDIHALVTGQLDAQQSFALADYLADHPNRAAEAMADLRIYEGLRLACTAVEAPPPEALLLGAARLERNLRTERQMRRIRPIAAALALFGLGWLGHGLWADPETHGPDTAQLAAHVLPLAETALDARAAVDLHRALLPGRPLPDPQIVAHTLGVALPPLPKDWALRDVQVVATPDSPALALMLDTPNMGEVMLLSIPRAAQGPDLQPRAFDYRGNSVAVFERGRSAYVLVDNSGLPAEVSRGADQFLRRFN